MKIKEKIRDFNKFLTHPRVVKACTIVIMLTFIPSIIIGTIVAYTFGGTEQGPGTYSIFTNYISDLGSFRYTPIPNFLDDAAMLTSVLMFPCIL
ncbi:MAG: hypothetical protein ACFFCS_29225, partial [Candidatus Hodarchaeota archaeon]